MTTPLLRKAKRCISRIVRLLTNTQSRNVAGHMPELTDWIDECTGEGFVWFAKRLSGNDTVANGSHQAGPYIPRDLLLELIPDLNKPKTKNPKFKFDLFTASHGEHCRAKAIWYNNKLRGGTRNETRVTNLGGRRSTLLNAESTGALCVFVFKTGNDACKAWICRNSDEADTIENRIGPVDPGKSVTWRLTIDDLRTDINLDARLEHELLGQIPHAWLDEFPTPIELIEKSIELTNVRDGDADCRLLERRKREYKIFRAVEEAIEFPRIQEQLSAADSIDTVLTIAQPMLQRRKSRSGRSLELHVRQIFLEEDLRENLNFSYQAKTEHDHQPDFLFPSADAYGDVDYPASSLRMLAVKTTCKDRWRQILNEADRIEQKHLLTLQEGISVNQFREMEREGIRLVVPSPLISKFPDDIRGNIMSLAHFIDEIRDLRNEN